MCDLYAIAVGSNAISSVFKVDRDLAGNQNRWSAVLPDDMAPIVRRTEAGDRQLEMMRWGFQAPADLGKAPVINIRDTASPYWRGTLKSNWRCLVPATAFCIYAGGEQKNPTWFALDKGRLFAFAGIWRLWSGERKGETREHSLFSFLTTEPNDFVRSARANAMPALLTTPEQWDAWLTWRTDLALMLQRPLPKDALRIVPAV